MKLFRFPLFINRKEYVSSIQSKNTSRFESSQTSPDAFSKEQGLARQLVLLNTVADISRKLSSNLRPDSLFVQAVTMMQDGFKLYFAGIFLLESSPQKVVFRAGTGEMGQRMLSDKFYLPVDDTTTVGWTIINRKPHVTFDRMSDPAQAQDLNLPLSKSELTLPLLKGEELIGAVTLHSENPGYFNEHEVYIYQSLADNLVVAYKNAVQFQNSQVELQEINSLYRKSLINAWGEVAANANELSFTFDNPESAENQVASNLVQIPLTLRDQVIGKITMEMGQDSLSPEELAFIDTVSIQTGLALDNARLLEETQKQVSREQLINRLSSHFSRAVNVEEILKAALQEIGRMPSVAEASVFLTQAHDSIKSEDKSPRQSQD